jgi:hypothetical protein
MTIDKGLLERLRSRGEEVFTQISAELMSNPRFVKGMERALRGKEKMEEAAARAIRTMNIPTRTEFKKAVRRIEALEEELAALKKKTNRTPRRTKSTAGAGRKTATRKPR